MKTIVWMEPPTEMQDLDNMPAQMGRMDALTGEICCPEMYFVNRDQIASYVLGYESVAGINDTTIQIITIQQERR